jgi:isocitrate/isopropylmalate dehydrogenase
LISGDGIDKEVIPAAIMALKATEKDFTESS